MYDAEPLVYLTFEKLSNGNVIVKHDPMHGGSWNKLGVIEPFYDIYIHKNNFNGRSPSGKTYFSMKYGRWVNVGE